MAVGGATWATAGALTLGSDNTFALADATEDDPPEEPFPLTDLAWWTFTPAVPGMLELAPAPDTDFGTRVYHGTDDEREKDFNVPGFGNSWLLREGREYHILAGLGEFDDPPPSGSYQLIATFEARAASPWLEDLQDDPDNYLIVTHGSLHEANPHPTYAQPPFARPEWMEDVVRQVLGRRGRYTIQEVLGGQALDVDTYACAIGHANNGEDDGSQHWNATGSGTDPTTPAICLPLSEGPAEGNSEDSTEYKVVHTDPDAPGAGIAGQVHADFHGPAYALHHLPVRDNLPPWGTLFGFSLDPEDHGYPADAILEWEEPQVRLLLIQIGDGNPIATNEEPLRNRWVLNDLIGPSPVPGGGTVWQKGQVGAPPSGPEDPTRPWMSFTYDDGNETTGEFHDVPHTEGWDGHDWVEDYEFVPDVSPTDWDSDVLAWPEAEALLGEYERVAHIAVKYLLEAPRFRFVFAARPAPRRIIQRPKDGLVGSGAQTIRSGSSRQTGSRTVGGVI